MSKAIARGSQTRSARPGRRRAGDRASAAEARRPAPALPDAVRRLSWWIFLGMMIALAGALLWALQDPADGRRHDGRERSARWASR